MRAVVLGAGPAGLYLALLLKKADPGHEVTVVERNPPDATYGWGVVFSEETLGALRDADRPSYDEITDTFAKWNAIDIRYRGETVRSRGHAFSAIARKRLLEILQRRCTGLGVDLRFHEEVTDPADLGEADLLVGADGVNSLVRRGRAEAFGTSQDVHGTRFVWFGTDLVFKAFTFIFRENEHGLFQVHGYPFDAGTSTFIVECPEETWRRAGLDQASEEESIAYCEKLFADDLEGHALLSNRSLWVNFVTLRNQTWHDGNVVLLGDAAHTAHFTIGSGTKLAMEDAVSLAEALGRRADLEAALTDYEMERQPVVERFQQAATESAAYFEYVRRYAGFEPIQFGFHLLTRSGRITHLELQKRDPAFVAAVDGWFAGHAAGSVGARATAPSLAAPPPRLAPLRVGGLTLGNRIAVMARTTAEADGAVGAAAAARLAEATASGAGLVLTDVVAVSAEGRFTPETSGLYADEQERAWREAVRVGRGPGGAAMGVRIGHAGRRGGTRPRAEGVDRPLRRGGWALLAPSPLPYAPWSRRPRAMNEGDLARVRDAFAGAATRAARAGFDLLELDMGHGGLLAAFLSPLANRRDDAYGGSPEGRLRYPLAVAVAVRAAWPPDRPLAVRLTAADRAPGGFGPDDAALVAAELGAHGFDLVEVVAGQTIPDDRPDYRRFYLVGLSDQVRNRAGLPTLVGGDIATADDADTVLASGRADLCLVAGPA